MQIMNEFDLLFAAGNLTALDQFDLRPAIYKTIVFSAERFTRTSVAMWQKGNGIFVFGNNVHQSRAEHRRRTPKHNETNIKKKIHNLGRKMRNENNSAKRIRVGNEKCLEIGFPLSFARTANVQRRAYISSNAS